MGRCGKGGGVRAWHLHAYGAAGQPEVSIQQQRAGLERKQPRAHFAAAREGLYCRGGGGSRGGVERQVAPPFALARAAQPNEAVPLPRGKRGGEAGIVRWY